MSGWTWGEHPMAPGAGGGLASYHFRNQSPIQEGDRSGIRPAVQRVWGGRGARKLERWRAET